MSNFCDKAAMEEAISSLNRYVRSMYISVDLPELDQKVMEEYFDTDDPKAQSHFEKMVGMAAIEAVYNMSEIPSAFKAKVAERASRELKQAFRGAKVEYEYCAGKYGYGIKAQKTYERKKKEIKLCCKAAWLDRIKRNMPRQLTKIAAKTSVHAALTTAGFSVGGPVGALIGLGVGLAVDAVWFLTPKSVKEKIKQKGGELAQKACHVIQTVADKVKSAPVVQKARTVVDKYVVPVVKPVYEAAKQKFEEIKTKGKRFWTAIKSILAR